MSCFFWYLNLFYWRISLFLPPYIWHLFCFGNLCFIWPFPSTYWRMSLCTPKCAFLHVCMQSHTWILCAFCSPLVEELFFSFCSLPSGLPVLWNFFFEMRDIVIREYGNCNYEHCRWFVVRDDGSCWQKVKVEYSFGHLDPCVFFWTFLFLPIFFQFWLKSLGRTPQNIRGA